MRPLPVHEVYQARCEAQHSLAALETAFSLLAQVGDQENARVEVEKARGRIAKLYVVLGKMLEVKEEES